MQRESYRSSRSGSGQRAPARRTAQPAARTRRPAYTEDTPRRRSADPAARRRTQSGTEPARRQPPARGRKKRRMTAAAKFAYARAICIAAVLFLAIGASIRMLGSLVIPNAEEKEQSSSAVEIADSNISSSPEQQPVPEVDSIGSASVQVLSGQQLQNILDARMDTVITSPEQNDEENPGESGESGASKWGTFDPSTVGASGQSNIAAWKAKNSDVVGWLRIPNTNINYPVVVGPDNLYYSAKGYDKNYSYHGVIWADSDTKFGNSSQISQNNVLYGHNWTNYTATPYIGRSSDIMFGQLPSFHYLNFAKSTPYIHYSTESQSMTWKVFAVFYTEESFNYIVSDPGAAGLQYIINEAKARSLHNYAVDVNSSDKILTLSTCTRAFGKTNQQRFVVMARLLRPGESSSDPVQITANPGYKRPQL